MAGMEPLCCGERGTSEAAAALAGAEGSGGQQGGPPPALPPSLPLLPTPGLHNFPAALICVQT